MPPRESRPAHEPASQHSPTARETVGGKRARSPDADAAPEPHAFLANAHASKTQENQEGSSKRARPSEFELAHYPPNPQNSTPPHALASDEQLFLEALADPAAPRLRKSVSTKKRRTKEKRLAAEGEKAPKLAGKRTAKKDKKGHGTAFRLGSLDVERVFDSVVSLVEGDDLVRLIVKNAQREHK